MPKKRTKPSKEMMADLQAVFKKHNWSGFPVRIQEASSAGTESTNARCPPGQSLQAVTVQRPDGTTEVRLVCI